MATHDLNTNTDIEACSKHVPWHSEARKCYDDTDENVKETYVIAPSVCSQSMPSSPSMYTASCGSPSPDK